MTLCERWFLAILNILHHLYIIVPASTEQQMIRRRGRPKSSQEQIAFKRAPILNAAAQMLSNTHSSAITVDQLIGMANISRPTFYRWFPQGIEQVIEYVIAEANLDLVNRLKNVVTQYPNIEDKIRESISSYFNWCVERGPVVYGIYREGFDEHSSAYRYRMQTRQFAVVLLQQYIQAIQIQNIDTMSVETMVSWIEGAAITLCSKFPILSSKTEAQAKFTTTMFLATLDSVSPDWRDRVAVYQAQNKA